MKKLLKIDPHTHSNGISRCSHVTCEQIIEQKQAAGYDGAVLTNHCQEWYYPPEEHKKYIRSVIEEYRRGKAYAKSRGFRLMLGLEVTLNEPHYADWLLYGVTEKFLRATPCLYQLTQKQLFELCEKHGVLLVQAHPYRQSPCAPEYMHGVEINCSPTDLDKVEQVEAFAKAHGLMITCGTDYHGAFNPYHGGMLVPASVKTATDFAAHLRAAAKTTVFMEEDEKTYLAPRFL
ncbi:MAG: hypothetical protein IKD47_00385 [Clostridia bacterium]|nr:hypothetical protein [Clostridia bacterium]